MRDMVVRLHLRLWVPWYRQSGQTYHIHTNTSRSNLMSTIQCALIIKPIAERCRPVSIRSIGCHSRAYLGDEKRDTAHKSTSCVLLVMLSPFNINYAIYYHYYYCGCCCCIHYGRRQIRRKKKTRTKQHFFFSFFCVYSKSSVYEAKDNRNETERENDAKKNSSSEKCKPSIALKVQMKWMGTKRITHTKMSCATTTK